MSSFGFDAPEDVTDTTRPDADSLPVPAEDPAQIDDAEAPGEASDEGADARLGGESGGEPAEGDDPEEMPAVPSPS
ncbi:hypothetical protein SAMN06295885_3373 [Rathayibacter oskolensis]|uniref:Uncharacterized protein n=1 Tax=Rathayibacter oskolensis TaxID=1891671 RepID=A0A1X7PE51_9MICO|nr:hypothetical protein [Rathayibacter oskolensis]SMH49651.1 hypothetical protein SAMN06295885_3373 [Rathayibacter oskolensis]